MTIMITMIITIIICIIIIIIIVIESFKKSSTYWTNSSANIWVGAKYLSGLKTPGEVYWLPA